MNNEVIDLEFLVVIVVGFVLLIVLYMVVNADKGDGAVDDVVDIDDTDVGLEYDNVSDTQIDSLDEIIGSEFDLDDIDSNGEPIFRARLNNDTAVGMDNENDDKEDVI